jgi:transposase-like protein
MSIRFSRSFKIQAVEKVLSRADNVTIKELADSLGVAFSTLNRRQLQARKQVFEPVNRLQATYG